MPAAESPQPLYAVAQVQAFDRRAIDELGILGIELMHRAAAAAFASLRRHWPAANRIAVYCGPGNNGGDGFLVAALARAQGLDVRVIALADASRGDAALARAQWAASGGVTRVWQPGEALPAADVHVDALYGTGLHRAPEPPVAALIAAIVETGAPVLALDVPSGLDADTGHAPGAVLQADVTVSFIAAKRGLYTGRAPALVGERECAPLDLPDSLCEGTPPDAFVLRPAHLPPRARDAHKGTNGHVLAVGGDHGMAGAIRLCGEAALRMGAGLVSVATRGEHLAALNAARPELMAHAVGSAGELAPLLARATVVALGPGLGQGVWSRELFGAALAAGKPTVIDADGLNLLARTPAALSMPAVLTPHPGEAARLLGTTPAAIAANRFAAVRTLAQRWHAVVVLKGAGTLVATPAGEVAVCPWGNPGMASGGMGDLLTGVIAALLAQGLEPWQAACLGVGLHARAGDRAARAGERGLLASDLLAPLRALGNGLDDE